MVRQIENKSGQETDNCAGKNDVDRIEQGFPSQTEVVRDVRVLMRATTETVYDLVARRGQSKQIPFRASTKTKQSLQSTHNESS